MSRVITLKYPGKCAECGAELVKGATARYYGPGRIYGVECHPQRTATRTARRERRAQRQADAARCEHGMFYSVAGACPQCGGGAEVASG